MKDNNMSSFATFAKQFMVESLCYKFEICERKFDNIRENVHALATFARGILDL